MLKTIQSALAALALGVTASSFAAEPLKIGFVYVGPVDDGGWTYSHDKARKAIEAEFKDRVQTSYVESVAEGADAERVIHTMAAQGNQLIFTTSFGFMNPTLKAAKRFPQVKFEHATGYKQAANVGTYNSRSYQGRYLAGIIAGRMSKTNVIGYVAPFPIPEVIRDINALTLGARSVNPAIQVKVVYVSAWYDPAKEREAAEALILQKADVLTQHTDSASVLQTAEAKGIYAIGYNADLSAYGHKAHLVSVIHNWAPIYIAQTRAVLDGTWKPQDLWYGLKENVTGLASLNPVIPAPTLALVEKQKAAIIAGTNHVFDGPIRDQSGAVKIAAGTSLPDSELLNMNWYVQGVEGTLPGQ